MQIRRTTTATTSRPKSAAEVTPDQLYEEAEENGDRPYREQASLGSHILSFIAMSGPPSPGPLMTRLERQHRAHGVSRKPNAGAMIAGLRTKRNNKAAIGIASALGGVAGIAAGISLLAGDFGTLGSLGGAAAGLAGAAGGFHGVKQLSQASEVHKVLQRTEELTEKLL